MPYTDALIPLTTNLDVVNASTPNSTIVGFVGTGSQTTDSYQNIDILQGGENTTLALNVLGLAGQAGPGAPGATNNSPVGFNISNVELRSTSNAGSVNLASLNGITNIAVGLGTGNIDVQGVGSVTSFAVADQDTNVIFAGGTAASVNLALVNVGDPAIPPPTIDFSDNILTSLTVNASNSVADLSSIITPTSISLDVTGANQFTRGVIFNTVETLTINGSGSVAVRDGGTFLPALQTLAAATASASIDIALTASATSVNTGSGNDSVDLTGAVVGLPSTARYNLGAGRNTLILDEIPAFGAALNGGGNGILNYQGSLTTALNTVNARAYSGFSTLELAGASGTADLSRLSGVNSVQVSANLANPVTVSNASAGTSLNYLADPAANITFAPAVDTLTNSLAVSIGEGVVPGGFNANTLVADAYEVFSINASTTTQSAISIDSDEAETLTVTGSGDLNLDKISTAASVTTLVDASASTGDIDAGGVVVSTLGALLIGGSGDDILAGNLGNDTLIGGSGSGADVLLGKGGNDTFEGGLGIDTFNIVGQLIDGTQQFLVNDFAFGANGDALAVAAAAFTAYDSTVVDVIINVGAANSIPNIDESNAGVNYVISDTLANLQTLSATGVATNVILAYASDQGEFYALTADVLNTIDFTSPQLIGETSTLGLFAAQNISIV